MADDFYKRLGVSRTASQEEIQKAYLQKARKYHPDLNPDNPEEAKKNFQELQEAFETLKDPEKRKLYDQFGEGYQQFGGGARAGSGGFGGFSGFGGSPFGADGSGINLDDILKGFGAMGGGGGFSQTFNFGGRRSKRRPTAEKGADTRASLEIDFRTSILGGKIPLTARDSATGSKKDIDVTIPPGIESGQKIRLAGMGDPGVGGGPNGNLIVTVNVKPHPCYSREGKDLRVRTPITLKEATFGGTIETPTPYGRVSVKIPKGSTSGTKLRIKGYGVRTGKGADGDLYLICEIRTPKEWSADDLERIKGLADEPKDVRKELEF